MDFVLWTMLPSQRLDGFSMKGGDDRNDSNP